MKKKLCANIKYLGKMDSDVIDLCDALNAIPGIVTFDSCCGHKKNSIIVFFGVDYAKAGDQGLFFLTRCCDRRYWTYGNKWNIKLSVGDRMHGNLLPTCFCLTSMDKGKNAYIQAKSLIKNMNLHLNHKNFIKFYNLDLSRFLFIEGNK